MNHQVQVFEVAKDAKPQDRPCVIDTFAVTADTLDEARRAAMARLKTDGRVVRSLSFVDGGGLAAVVHAAPPKPPAAKPRRARGGR